MAEDERSGSMGGDPMFIHIPKEEMARILAERKKKREVGKEDGPPSGL